MEIKKKYKLDTYQKNKRLFDLICSGIGLILLSPIFLIICIVIKCYEPKGTILFKQKRIGKDGEYFYIYKFRSMRMNADKILENDAKLYTKYIDSGYKLDPKEDPRITKLGLFIRKTSIDELPQLINVLKGEMSLVGPRPIVEQEIVEYEKQNKVNEFLRMKPGITGIWQISGRSNVGYPERVDLEISYLNNQSIMNDFKIILSTLMKVIIREGAY